MSIRGCPKCEKYALIETRTKTQLVCSGPSCDYYEAVGPSSRSLSKPDVAPVPVAPTALEETQAKAKKLAAEAGLINANGQSGATVAHDLAAANRESTVKKATEKKTIAPKTAAAPAAPKLAKKAKPEPKSEAKPEAKAAPAPTPAPVAPTAKPKKSKPEKPEKALTVSGAVKQMIVAFAAKHDTFTLEQLTNRAIELKLTPAPTKWHYAADVKPDARERFLASHCSRRAVYELVARGVLKKAGSATYSAAGIIAKVDGRDVVLTSTKVIPTSPKSTPPKSKDKKAEKPAEPFAVGSRVRLAAHAPASFRKLASYEELDTLVVRGRTGKDRVDVQAGDRGVKLSINRAHLEAVS